MVSYNNNRGGYRGYSVFADRQGDLAKEILFGLPSLPSESGQVYNPFNYKNIDGEIYGKSMSKYQMPNQGYTNQSIVRDPNNNGVFAGGRSLLDNVYGNARDTTFKVNTPNVVRMKNANEMDLLRRRNPTSLDTSQFQDPNVSDPLLRNFPEQREDINKIYSKIPKDQRKYVKVQDGQVFFEYPEELETPDMTVPGVSNQPNIEQANKGLLTPKSNQENIEKANKGLLGTKEKPKMTMQGLLDKAVQFATSDFGRDFFMNIDDDYSTTPKSFLSRISNGYNVAKANEREREKLDIERTKANKLGGDQNFAYIVTDPNTGNKYNAFVDRKNGRVLVNVDGEKKAWSPGMFGGEVPAEISTVSNLGKSDLTGNVFIKEKRELTTFEEDLTKLTKFMENVDNGPVGMEKLATQFSSYLNTILGKNDLTPQELRQKVLEGDFQALIGANRIEVVGGGVMTEQDAIRIIKALGGDPADISTNPEAVITEMSKIFAQKYNTYKDALETYNINVTSGGFGAYPKKELIEFNDNFLNILSPDQALRLDLTQIPDFSKTQLLRLLNLNTNSDGLVIDDAFTDIQKEQIIALAKTFNLELDFDEEVE